MGLGQGKTSVIQATWDVEAGRSQVQGQTVKVKDTLSQKQNINKRARALVEHE
jgi:hypothetical protein